MVVWIFELPLERAAVLAPVLVVVAGAASRGQVDALARELGLASTTASVLVRRGYSDPERAREFLGAELPEHDPFRLGDMREACAAIRAAVAAGKRICVHGDYDADGI